VRLSSARTIRPTSNLVGRVEHTAQFGALVTDFTMIKPGVLHKANGGYLLLDVRRCWCSLLPGRP